MNNYTVRIKCEFLENVEANNEKEAEQLALRMLNMSLGARQLEPGVAKINICRSPSQEEGEPL